MASENIGELYPTKIPGYDDAADIQAALRLYHYGSTTYDVNNNVISAIPNPSMAYTLNNLQEQITSNYNSPAAAAEVQDAEPVSPVDGFLWVHTDAEYTGLPLSATSIYQNTTPTSGLIEGLLWIKKGSSPLEMSVYDADANTFLRVI
jgi:hypothetical protein